MLDKHECVRRKNVKGREVHPNDSCLRKWDILNDSIQISYKKIEIFLSYSTLDKKFAAELKDALNHFGLKVFLAHQDLTPSVQWQDTILSNLRICDVFVPILTKNFNKSLWTDQESGFAFSLNKHILPLRIQVNPYGFLSRYQALTGNKRKPMASAEHVLQALAEHKTLRARLLKYLIKSFGDSDSFVIAIATSKALLSLSPLTAAQMKRIIDYADSNDQIYNSVGAINNLRQLFQVNKKSFSEKQLRKYGTQLALTD